MDEDTPAIALPRPRPPAMCDALCRRCRASPSSAPRRSTDRRRPNAMANTIAYNCALHSARMRSFSRTGASAAAAAAAILCRRADAARPFIRLPQLASLEPSFHLAARYRVVLVAHLAASFQPHRSSSSHVFERLQVARLVVQSLVGCARLGTLLPRLPEVSQEGKQAVRAMAACTSRDASFAPMTIICSRLVDFLRATRSRSRLAEVPSPE